MPNFGDCAVGSGQAEATLLSEGRFIDGSTDSQKRNPTGTEPKVRLEKQCEWKRGSEILRSKIMAAFRNSAKCRREEATCHSFLFDHFASRHPVQATLRLAPLGLDRDPSRCREPTLRRRNGRPCPGRALFNFPLDIDRPSHGRPVKTRREVAAHFFREQVQGLGRTARRVFARLVSTAVGKFFPSCAKTLQLEKREHSKPVISWRASHPAALRRRREKFFLVNFLHGLAHAASVVLKGANLPSSLRRCHRPFAPRRAFPERRGTKNAFPCQRSRKPRATQEFGAVPLFECPRRATVCP